MQIFTLVSATIFGALAVIFGAFGAHALKKNFSEDLMKSYETGIKYQMYHALVLLLLGFNMNVDTGIQKLAVWCFILGILFFSFSIYGLCLSAAKGNKMKFLEPVTPIGGVLLLTGWCLLFWTFLNF